MKTAAAFAVVGIVLGLAAASLYNTNCDSFVEVASGCTRLSPGGAMFDGAVIGAIVGAARALARRRS